MDEIDYKKIDEIIEKYKDKKGALILLLEEVQEFVGYLPKEVILRIADSLNISRSIVYGVVTFYSFFSLKPQGRNIIRVCLGTACYVKGGGAVLERIKEVLKIAPSEITPDRRFSLNVVRCVGVCGLAPVVMINNDVYGPLTPAKVERIFERYK